MAEATRTTDVDRHLRRRTVEAPTGLSRSTIHDLIAQGESPRPVKPTGRAMAWPESAIARWLAERAKTEA